MMILVVTMTMIEVLKMMTFLLNIYGGNVQTHVTHPGSPLEEFDSGPRGKSG